MEDVNVFNSVESSMELGVLRDMVDVFNKEFRTNKVVHDGTKIEDLLHYVDELYGFACSISPEVTTSNVDEFNDLISSVLVSITQLRYLDVLKVTPKLDDYFIKMSNRLHSLLVNWDFSEFETVESYAKQIKPSSYRFISFASNQLGRLDFEDVMERSDSFILGLRIYKRHSMSGGYEVVLNVS